MPGPRNMTSAKPKSMRKTLSRAAGYLFRQKSRFFAVMLFVLLSAGANVAGTYFIRPLLNDCIVPLIGKNVTAADFVPFVKMIALMGGIYAIGVVASFIYSQLMVKVSNGMLNAVRNDLFNKMQDLPIRYFDTHTHGELMSRFTSDVDTLREAITMGVTQLLSSALTVVGTFIMMLVLSPILTLLIVVMLALMMYIIKKSEGTPRNILRNSKRRLAPQTATLRKQSRGRKW